MPSLGVLYLADGQATPVTQTFGISRNTGELIEWSAKLGEMPGGWPKVTFTSKWNKTGDLLRSKWVLEVPVIETPASGPQRRIAVNRFVGEAFVSAKSSAAERNDLAAYAKSMAQSSNFATIIKDLETYW